jgi:hypothetical protein
MLISPPFKIKIGLYRPIVKLHIHPRHSCVASCIIDTLLGRLGIDKIEGTNGDESDVAEKSISFQHCR